MNNGNYDGWINIWADTGIQMAPNAPIRRGKDEIAKGSEPFFAEFNFNMEIHSVEILKLTKSIGVVLTLYSFAGTPKNGGDEIVFEPNGKSITFWEKHANQWKLQLDCFNSNVEL